MSNRGSEITQNAWVRAEADPEVVRLRQHAADLRANAQRMQSEIKALRSERDGLDLTDPLVGERAGKLDLEIAGRKSTIVNIEDAASEAQSAAGKAFKAARMAGVGALHAEEDKVYGEIIGALEAVLAGADDLKVLHGQIGHLGGYGGKKLDDQLEIIARGVVQRWHSDEEDRARRLGKVAA